MSATNKTPNLDLPQWEQGDEIEREDFNAAFDKIDGYASDGTTATISSLQNGWTGSITCIKRPDGLVYMHGIVDTGTTAANTVIAQIPVGFRPAGATHPIAAVCASPTPAFAFGLAVLRSNGNIMLYGALSGASSGSTLRLATSYIAD